MRKPGTELPELVLASPLFPGWIHGMDVVLKLKTRLSNLGGRVWKLTPEVRTCRHAPSPRRGHLQYKSHFGWGDPQCYYHGLTGPLE